MKLNHKELFQKLIAGDTLAFIRPVDKEKEYCRYRFIDGMLYKSDNMGDTWDCEYYYIPPTTGKFKIVETIAGVI